MQHQRPVIMSLARMARLVPQRGLSITRSSSGGIAPAAVANADQLTPIMKGMVVLELANVLAGPSVCQFFAELGAEVIKVENMGTNGDVTRTWKLRGETKSKTSELDPTVSAYFCACNSGKQSMSLDLQNPKGLKIVHDLVRKADVVIASYKPGDAEKLKVDAATLRALNPRLIYGQITGYGSKDPRAGYDAVIQAESGFQMMNGEPTAKHGTKMPVALVDLLTAHQLKQAVLIALWRRSMTGVGSSVDVCLFQASVASLANQATGYLVAGRIPGRMGSDHPSICPYGTIFTTKDGKELVPAVGSDKQFQALCEVLGIPDVPKNPKFTRNVSRVENREELKKILLAEFKKFDRDPLLKALNVAAVPMGAVNDMKDVFELPLSKELIVKHKAENVGLRQIAFRGGAEGLERQVALSAPPKYAGHTKQVLSGKLSLSTAEIEQLVKDRVIVV